MPQQLQKASTTNETTSNAVELSDPVPNGAQPNFLPARVIGGKSEYSQQTSTSVDAKPKAHITSHFCDGECGTAWTDMLADRWVSKHCLCVQLCPGCYQKLQSDYLHLLICNKDHKLLYLPAFDKDMWQNMSPYMIIVSKQLMPRGQWLNKIRDKYGVQQEQIDFLKIEKARDLKAAGCIVSHIMSWRRRVLERKASKPPTVSVLRRVNTVV